MDLILVGPGPWHQPSSDPRGVESCTERLTGGADVKGTAESSSSPAASQPLCWARQPQHPAGHSLQGQPQGRALKYITSHPTTQKIWPKPMYLWSLLLYLSFELTYLVATWEKIGDIWTCFSPKVEVFNMNTSYTLESISMSEWGNVRKRKPRPP